VTQPPATEAELLARAHALAGLRLGELAASLNLAVPTTPRQGKGWMGQLLETVLGADAGNLPEPDFRALGVELKTIPVDMAGRPKESTYVCRAPARPEPASRWEDSVVRRKLTRVLWLPIEAASLAPLPARRIGWARLWSPDTQAEALLRSDWEELTALLVLGRQEEISARLGSVMQLRPKAADASVTAPAFDADGVPATRAPLAWYLRAAFTGGILAEPG
jgi:DNA mismatch repair protein MutH